jgi:integrase
MGENIQLQPNVINNKLIEIRKTINGYWENDVWDLKDPFFENYFAHGGTDRYINFSKFKKNLNIEVKFFFRYQIKEIGVSLHTMRSYKGGMKHFSGFIANHYPNIKSFIEIPKEKGLMQYKSYLVEKKLKVFSYHTNLFNGIIDFLTDYYDDRCEYDKDIWHVKNLPDVNFTKNTSRLTLKFTAIPTIFKETVKNYCKFRLTINSFGDSYTKLRSLRSFFIFISNERPSWRDFKSLDRSDVEEYFKYVKKDNSGKNWEITARISSLRSYLEYLQNTKNIIAPTVPVRSLVFKEDYPKLNSDRSKIKHIPESVISQLEQLINTEPEKLDPPIPEKEKRYIPLVILLLASGWRGSDILSLKYDNCILLNNGWYLQGDIPKTQVKSHRIPIDDEIAKMVQKLIEKTKKDSTQDNNPEKFLFPSLKGKRKGLPIHSKLISDALNRWAKIYSILDDQGKPYHFKNHAFRHTKGVELINSGMNILHVQKWMAHSSPEMTLVYAKIADSTLRNEWLEARDKTNFFKIEIEKGNLNELTDKDLLEWDYIRHNVEAAKVPMGYCMASQKMGCPYVETPCLTCTNFCTTPDNLPEFDAEINNLESLIERTKDMPIWNEKNQKRHQKLLEIRETLAQGKIHHLAGKKAREYPKGDNTNVKS